jgi:hypothetical protein
MWTNLIAVAWMTTPRMKTQVAIRMPYFLDAVSAMKPLSNVPNHAPSSRMDVNHPFRP